MQAFIKEKRIYIYKHDLIEMIVTGKNKQIIEEINMLLSSITNKKIYEMNHY